MDNKLVVYLCNRIICKNTYILRWCIVILPMANKDHETVAKGTLDQSATVAKASESTGYVTWFGAMPACAEVALGWWDAIEFVSQLHCSQANYHSTRTLATSNGLYHHVRNAQKSCRTTAATSLACCHGCVDSDCIGHQRMHTGSLPNTTL